MGGEGSMMNANVSLKNNRGMLSKRRERRTHLGAYANKKLKEFPMASEQDILEIQEEMKKKNRTAKFRNSVLFIIVFMIVLFGFLHLLK